MGSTTTSPTLLSRVRDPADDASWREFERRYGDLILRYCRRRGLQLFDAEDVRQMVLMRLATVLRGFQHEPARGRFRTFLGCVVQNEISRYFRRPNPLPGRVDINEMAEDDVADAEQPDDQWDLEWTQHHLRMAMHQVRDSHDARTVDVFNRLLAGHLIEEVARDMEMTTDAVHKIKQRLRDRLRDLVAAQIRDEDQPHA